jgi:hypothetical protein
MRFKEILKVIREYNCNVSVDRPKMKFASPDVYAVCQIEVTKVKKMRGEAHAL